MTDNAKKLQGPVPVYHLIVLVAGVCLGLSAIIWIRAAYDDIYVAFSSVLIWQFGVWAPWLGFGFIVSALARRLPYASMQARNWYVIHIVVAVVITGVHYQWFRFISDTISPFLGMEHTRYGVFAFFFVFWSALDLALYSLILAYAHSSWFYQRQLSGQQRLAELELELNQAINTSKPHEHLEYFTVRKTSKRHVIPAREVQWIEADGYYAKLHTAEGGYLLRESLNTLDAQLDSKLFVRVHRSTIVNTGYIKEFGPDNNGAWTIALTGGVIRRVSRSGRQRLESRFK